MTDDTATLERRSTSWLKGQLNLPNIIAVIGIVIGLTAAKAAMDTRDEIQDLKLQALEKRVEVAEATSVRRDLYDQRIGTIDEKLNAALAALAEIRRAVK